MKLLNSSLLFLLAALTFNACGDDENDYNIGTGKEEKVDPQPNIVTVNYPDIEVPKVSSKNGSFVITHTGLLNSKTGEKGVNYRVEWDPQIHAPRWVSYKMYGKVVNGVMQGTNAENTDRYVSSGSLEPESQYPNDPDIDSKYQFTSDPFRNSGYDHGHICPSADRLCSSEANYQTFYMTNMMPQVNKFNAGIWAAMEGKIRTWSRIYDTHYVCKGGTIDNEKYIIKYLGSGSNKIPVPKYFFMAVLGYKYNTVTNKNEYSALAFWIEHSSSIAAKDDLKKYTYNIRTLEGLTGLDFFYNLPDEVEEWVETLPEATIKSTWL